MPDIGWYGLVLVIAVARRPHCTIPARRIVVRVGYVAHPSERSVHTRPIPYGGGAAMFMGFLVAVLGASAVPQLRPIFQDSPEMTGVVFAAGAMFAVGLIDDVRDMSAPAKMAGQVLAASILYFSGATMYELKIPLAGFFVLTPGIIPLITAVWVIALTNVVNLIDGLDGLAAGVVAIGRGRSRDLRDPPHGSGSLPGDNIGPLVAVIVCGGICLGFLPFNFNPARIFMGDAGALFLGLLMAVSTMVIGGRVPTAVPISGVTYLLLRTPVHPHPDPRCSAGRHGLRLRPTHGACGRGFDTPDKEHIHHRLPRLGHGPRRSVIILWAWTAILSSFLLFPLFVHQVNAFIPHRGGCARGGPLHLLPPRPPSGQRGGRGARTGAFPRPRGRSGGSARWSGSPRDRLDAIWAGMR